MSSVYGCPFTSFSITIDESAAAFMSAVFTLRVSLLLPYTTTRMPKSSADFIVKCSVDCPQMRRNAPADGLPAGFLM